MDASNLLKPMLGRGELRCIGATTLVRPRGTAMIFSHKVQTLCLHLPESSFRLDGSQLVTCFQLPCCLCAGRL